MNCSTPGLPVHHQLPEFTQTHVHRVSDAYHPAISFSVVPFFSCPQSLPASKSFPMSQLFARGVQSTGVSAPLQYSCLENPMNSMIRQNDRILKEVLPRSVGAQYATGGQWRNNSRKKEGMEPKQKQYPAVDVTGDRNKVRCCKEQYCIGTWNVRSMNQGKLEGVKQEMARVNAGQEATVRPGYGTTDWFQIGKGVHQGCILSPCLFNLYAEYNM